MTAFPDEKSNMESTGDKMQYAGIKEAQRMYIEKYWGNYLGGSDDSLNLVTFLADQQKDTIPLGEIFAKIGLDKQNWDFRRTVGYLEFTHSNGV